MEKRGGEWFRRAMHCGLAHLLLLFSFPLRQAVPGTCCSTAPGTHGLCACWYEVESCAGLRTVAELCCLHGGWAEQGCFSGSRNFNLCCGETMGLWDGSTFTLTQDQVLDVTTQMSDAELHTEQRHVYFFGHLLKHLKSRIAVEVGVFRGEFGAGLLRVAPQLQEYFAVDPWVPQPNSEDLWNLGVDEQHDNFLAAAKALHAAGGERVHIVQMPSVNASRSFLNDSIDFVYLDGRHDYCSVLADLRAWWPKIRRGGVLAGDDYHRAEGSSTANSWQLCPFGSRHRGGVLQAVDDFFSKQFGRPWWTTHVAGGSGHVLTWPLRGAVVHATRVDVTLQQHAVPFMAKNPCWFVQKPVAIGSGDGIDAPS